VEASLTIAESTTQNLSDRDVTSIMNTRMLKRQRARQIFTSGLTSAISRINDLASTRIEQLNVLAGLTPCSRATRKFL
jgi:hypothetical protein